MPIDFFASARSTALISLVAASLASPVVVKSDAWSAAGARIDAAGERISALASREAGPELEQLVAGGIAFYKPAEWGVLGAGALRANGADDSARDAGKVGAVVSGLCPGGSSGSSCTDGVQVTFVAYKGGEGHALPALSNFERQLNERLAEEFRGYELVQAQQRAGVDGSRYLDYEFTYRQGRAARTQRIAAFRRADGSGVVALAPGARLAEHDAALNRFFASSHELLEAE